MVCEGTYLFPININSHYYVLQRNKSINTIVSLKKIIYVNINVICYYSKGLFSLCLGSISQNDYNTFSNLHFPMKEHDNIMDENNRRESI